MDYESFAYYSCLDLTKPKYPNKPEYLKKLDEYKKYSSRYNQLLNDYRNEVDKRKQEFIKEISIQNNISYQKGKQIYNQCLMDAVTNNIIEIYNKFEELVKIHKALNNK